MTELVWYVSYGSNMHADRLACYLSGGRAPGAARSQPGCRDGTPPRRSHGTVLPGGIHFATRSQVWNGGRAFYDPALPGPGAAARAWLVTAGQFADIAAQEMYRAPGADLDLSEVLTRGRATLGPGRYETLVHAGEVDGCPQLTFTAPHGAGEVNPVAPPAAYLRMLAGARAGARLEPRAGGALPGRVSRRGGRVDGRAHRRGVPRGEHHGSVRRGPAGEPLPDPPDLRSSVSRVDGRSPVRAVQDRYHTASSARDRIPSLE